MDLKSLYQNQEELQKIKQKVPSTVSIRHLANELDYSINSGLGTSKKAAVLFSGGVDSSLVAKVLANKAEIVLFTTGLETSSAIKRSEKAAKILQLPLEKAIVEKEELKFLSEKVSKIIDSTDGLQLSIALK